MRKDDGFVIITNYLTATLERRRKSMRSRAIFMSIFEFIIDDNG